jgi:hypothetical protein
VTVGTKGAHRSVGTRLDGPRSARELSHSVDTLVGSFVGAPPGDEALANQRIEQLLATHATISNRSSSCSMRRRRAVPQPRRSTP